MEREALERVKAETGVLRELQPAHEHGYDRTGVDPQSPSFSVSAGGSVSAQARSPPSTDVNAVPADQVAPIHVPVDDGAGAGAVTVLGRVASADAASFMSPRVDVNSSDETISRAEEQAPWSPVPVASTLEVSLSTRAEPRPESVLEGFKSPSNLEEVLRSEAYGWPRLVFPPLKKSGHIIIDACTREGSYLAPLPTAVPVYPISSDVEMKGVR